MDIIPTSDPYHQTVKLYTKGWIGFAAFVGGPLAGAYLIAKNFEYLGKKDQAQNSIKLGVIVSLLLFGALPFIPMAIMEKVPNFLLPVLYTSIIYSLVHKYQENDILEHLKNHGAVQSGWKVTGISLLALALCFLYIMGIILFLPESMLG